MYEQNVRLPVAILAGGLATRLRPLTEKVPKVMVEVAGKPFLEHQLSSLGKQGITDVVLCVGFLGESVESYFGDGSGYGVRIKYSYDGPALLGTGGALRRALPLLGEAFYILYGDSYLQIDFASVATAFVRSACSGLMTVFSNCDRWDKSNATFSSGRVLAYDKVKRVPEMKYIDYGLSILKASVLAEYSQDQVLDLADVLTRLADRGDLAGFEASERFYEIGSHDGLSELHHKLMNR